MIYDGSAGFLLAFLALIWTNRSPLNIMIRMALIATTVLGVVVLAKG
jgi:hypothetical protein